jgi:hypothetical protein
MNDRPEWFTAKTHGLGSGLPCSWQGWVVLGIYLAITLGTTFAFADQPIVILSIVLPLTAILLVIAARTTRGGWRWRWGEKD